MKSINEKSNLSIKIIYDVDFILAKPQRIENMAKIIYQMLELPDKLKVMGEDIKDNHVTYLLLVSVLLKSYDNSITALEARYEIELMSYFIKNTLPNEYNRRKERKFDRRSSQVYKILFSKFTKQLLIRRNEKLFKK